MKKDYKKRLLLAILVFLVILATSFFLFLPRTHAPVTSGTFLEDGAEVVENLNQACETDDECELPMDYAIRSICPYQARCVEGECVVVCPKGWQGL